MTALPTTPGSVVQADSLLMLTRWGNWVSDGVFTISATELSDEDFTVLFDAADIGIKHCGVCSTYGHTSDEHPEQCEGDCDSMFCTARRTSSDTHTDSAAAQPIRGREQGSRTGQDTGHRMTSPQRGTSDSPHIHGSAAADQASQGSGVEA
jgi:hypothetical protein